MTPPARRRLWTGALGRAFVGFGLAALVAAGLPACWDETDLAKTGASADLPKFASAADFAAVSVQPAPVNVCPSGVRADLTFAAPDLVFGLAVVVPAAGTLSVRTEGPADLDTLIGVYGPDDGTFYFGAIPIAVDDDAGDGLLSALAVEVAAGGTYFVVATTAGGHGRGAATLAVSTSACAAECVAAADCASADPCRRATCEAGRCVFTFIPNCGAACTEPTPEVCDGVDNDCDGLIDEGCAGPCTADADCDGDGACPARCVNGLCVLGGDLDGDGVCDGADADTDNDGYPDDADCAPFDPAIHPGVGEVCDGVDNNCNGVVDENCAGPCATDADCGGDGACPARCVNGLCVLDGDLDGDGVCDGADGDTDNDGYPDDVDCAPVDPATHPGASEVCDGVDNNCDGVVDGNCAGPCTTNADCADGGACPARCVNGLCVLDGDLDGDGVCDSADADTDNDGFTDDVDCAPSDAAVHPAADEVCDGIDNDCDGRVDEGCDVPCLTHADCDDGDPCTVDTCVAGRCGFTPAPDCD